MIRPKGIFLLIIAILVLGFSFNTNIQFFYFLFLTAASIFIVSLLSMMIFAANISTKRSSQGIAYEDDFLNIKLDILNNRFFPCFFVEVIDRFEGEEVAEREKRVYLEQLRSKESRAINYTMRCYKRGLWKLGPMSIVSQDLLGFFELKKTKKDFREVLVYPKLFNIIYFTEPKSSSLILDGCGDSQDQRRQP